MTPPGARTRADRGRTGFLLALLVAPLVLLFALTGPIAQDLRYHQFVDERAAAGVPNFANVTSNAPFLLVGVLGLLLCARGRIGGARTAWSVFFAGVLLSGIGSAYYHWTPENRTLAWDRLPMTLALMGLFSAVLAEQVHSQWERRLLLPAVLLGFLSIAWWGIGDDLRLYVWVQLSPFLALVYTLIAFPARFTHRGLLAAGAGCYGLAKVAEFADAALYTATSETISGHTLKHLLAAAATFCVYLMLRWRTPQARRER